MKRSVVLAVSAVFSSLAMAQQAYVEKTYIFTQDFTTIEPAREECDAGISALTARFDVQDIDPTTTIKVRINSVQTRGKNGKVENYQVGDIGSLLICQGQHDETNQLPLYYEITLGKVKYIATGGGTSPNFPELPSLPGGGVIYSPPGFPTETTAFEIYSATVLPSREGRRGGVYAAVGLHQHVPPGPDTQFETSFLSVLSVIVPVENRSQ